MNEAALWTEDFAPFHPGSLVANLADVMLGDAVLPCGSMGKIVSVRPSGGYTVRFGNDVVILAHRDLCDNDPLYRAA